MSKETKERESSPSHRTIALKVISLIGNENLIWALGKIWKWNGQGLWEPIEDRVIKKMIHEMMDDRKITRFSIDSVLDITKTEIFMDNHHFDVDTRSINCLNGELHFKNGAWCLEPHDKRHFRTTQVPIFYDPDATAFRFEQFLEEIRLGPNKKPFQYAAKPFIFRGMITCGHCGCLVSPEIKKGKYVYYSCTNAKGTCHRDYINEKDFLKEVSHYFDEISLSQEVI